MESQISFIAALISIVSGGLSGATLSLAVNTIRENQKKRVLENETIKLLLSQLNFCEAICKSNGHLENISSIDLLQLPVNVIESVVFNNQISYQKLHHLSEKLLIIYICAKQLNNQIQYCQNLLISKDDNRSFHLLEDTFKDIVQTCNGTQIIHTYFSIETINFPLFIADLISEIKLSIQ